MNEFLIIFIVAIIAAVFGLYVGKASAYREMLHILTETFEDFTTEELFFGDDEID